MSQSNNKEVFQFDVNKTVYFQHGQEISELVKISLDPDILIKPEEEYIFIRGNILLQGEYIKAFNAEVDESIKPTNYVENVTDLDQNHAKFQHKLPVDITIPSYRVNSIDNLSVVIQSFDYELPSSNKLKVTSTIDVNGIRTEAVEHQELPIEEKPLMDKASDLKLLENIPEELPTVRDGDKPEKEEGKIKMEKKVEEEENPHKIEMVPSPQLRQHDIESEIIEENQNEHDQNTDEMEHSLLTPLKREPEVETELIEDTLNADLLEDDLSTPHEPEEETEIEIQLNEGEDNEDEDDVKDVHFLTTMFNREQDESYTKLRIYIVQDDDTVQTIAKRYEVSSLKLLQLNNVSDEDLVAGELLYIPETSEG